MGQIFEIKGMQKHRAAACAFLRLAAVVAVLIIAAPLRAPAQDYTIYSGASFDNTSVYGWSVTDAPAPLGWPYTHTSYAKATLRSPSGRTATSPTYNAANFVRADVTLPALSEVGYYLTNGNHSAYCVLMLWFLLDNPTQDSTLVYDLTVTLTPTTVQPDGIIGGSATTTVRVQTNPVASGKAVTLSAVRIPNTGGHPSNHPLPNSAVTGTFTPNASGTTDANGRLERTYKASIYSGQHNIQAASSGRYRWSTLDVKLSGLQQLTGGANYIASNSAAGIIAHPDNWWGTSATLSHLGPIAQAYASRFPGAVLGYNDISLRWGGKFDGNSFNWTGGHIEHRLGNVIDVTYCGPIVTRTDYVSPDRRDDVVEIFSDNGMLSHEDECAALAHWHMRF